MLLHHNRHRQNGKTGSPLLRQQGPDQMDVHRENRVMTTIAETLTQALRHHQAGALAQAELLYHKVLQAAPDQVDALHLLGVISYQTGRGDSALEYISRALQLKPDFAEAHNSLANVLRKQGKWQEAMAHYLQAVRIQPGYVDAHSNLGNLLWEQGRLKEAVASLQQVVQLRPDDAQAHYHLGVARLQQGNWEEAIAAFRQALRLRQDYPEALSNLGSALREQGRVEEALACLRQAVHLKADRAETHNALGVTLGQEGKWEEALACFRQAVALRPDYAEALSNLGVAWERLGNWEEAIACCRQALALSPDHPDALINLGIALQEQGDLAAALAALQRAVLLKPDDPEIHNNLGVTRLQRRELAEAEASFRQAVHLNPDHAQAHSNLGMLLLLQGNFEQGWPEFEWFRRCKGHIQASFRQPTWDGSPLNGRTILVHAEEGLGDTLQLVRYAALVKERGGAVVVSCPGSLVSLLRRCPGIDRVVAEAPGMSEGFDVHVPLHSLPRLLGTTLANMPAPVPYLTADPARSARWRAEVSAEAAFKVGIVWQGNPRNTKDRRRSIALAHFAPLAAVLGVRLFSLQVGPGREQLPAATWLAQDLGGRFATASFEDAAAALVALDLVITVDTALAHLAGALAVPAWVALPFMPGWRWLLDREDSPWYPTLRLFRQKEQGDWEGVFVRMACALRHLTATNAERNYKDA
jgi:Flp pilus assembly protein TadD